LPWRTSVLRSRPNPVIRAVESHEPAEVVFTREREAELAERADVLCWQVDTPEALARTLDALHGLSKRFRDQDLMAPAFVVLAPGVPETACQQLVDAGAVVFGGLWQDDALPRDAEELSQRLQRLSEPPDGWPAWTWWEAATAPTPRQAPAAEGADGVATAEAETDDDERLADRRFEGVGEADFQAVLDFLQGSTGRDRSHWRDRDY